jgi:hypothetical protein
VRGEACWIFAVVGFEEERKKMLEVWKEAVNSDSFISRINLFQHRASPSLGPSSWLELLVA